MTNKIIILTLLSLLISSCSNNSKQQDPLMTKPGSLAQPVLPSLVGLWKSSEPEIAGNGQYMIREYNINLSRWELIQTLFADKTLSKPIFTYRAEGSYILEQSSAIIAGAFNLVMKISKKNLTLKTKDKSLIADLGFQNCKLIMGKEKDITNSGCSTFKNIGDCQQEYDLVKLENGLLRFGERPADNELCTPDHRPESLGPGLKKIN